MRRLAITTLACTVAVLLTTLLPVPGTAPARAVEATAASPLTVHLARLTPSAIPLRGKIILAGTVRNDSAETWTAINVHPFISGTPMTNRDELAAAAASDPSNEVGTRLVLAGQFATIGSLLPGGSAGFRIKIAVKDLPISGAPGVYWIGVHALGQNSAGRDGLADGRARTFIPLVRGKVRTSVAVVVPVREPVRRDPEGRVVGTTAWSDSLAPTGRLGRLAGFLASAGTRPATMLVDPAVLDAVADLGAGNPVLSLGEPTGPSTTPTPSPDGASRTTTRLDPADRTNASTWLSQVTAAARVHTVLGLGFSDPDAVALARRRPSLLVLAMKLAAQTFTGLKIPAVPAVAPVDGWFDDDLLDRVPAESMVLLSDHAAPRTRTQWRTNAHQDLIFTDDQAAAGGPGPTPALDALALRQRILSDAALRLPGRTASPMVVQFPADWNPGPGWQLADFFNGLDQPWLDLVPLSPSNDQNTPTFDAALGYPAAQRRLEVAATNVTSARSLVHTTTVLAQLLRSKNTVAHDLAGAALSAVSYGARADEVGALIQVQATTSAIQSVLGKVQVLGTDFVTLSGGSGTLAVTLVNGLDQPVEVGIRPRASTRDVQIEDTPPMRLAPGQRTVLRLKAKASKIGVTQVVLTPVTADGAGLGTPLIFSLRTSQVGKLIWAVLLAGGLLLVVMIGRRIRRGLREHRWRRA